MVTQYDASDADHASRQSQARLIGDALYIDKFSCYVEKGIDLPVGTDKEQTYHPVTEYQDEVSFDVCTTRKPVKEIEYLKDTGVGRHLSTLKTVSAPVDKSVAMSKRGVSMKLSFGGTELGIKCTRCSDGHEVKATTVFVQDIEDTRYGAIL